MSTLILSRAAVESLFNLKKNRELVVKMHNRQPGFGDVPLDATVKRLDDGSYELSSPTPTKVHPHAQANDTILRKMEIEASGEEYAPPAPPAEERPAPPAPSTKPSTPAAPPPKGTTPAIPPPKKDKEEDDEDEG